MALNANKLFILNRLNKTDTPICFIITYRYMKKDIVRRFFLYRHHKG